ncbi:ATP-binding protein [Fontimonas sp. SYSU GA230001]|uniref:sensor histidine kinase n=1 Tax=Fontimonas sp. SYSU GA230001 TaxID=3142450 RepID=UPI0032B5C03C
MQALSIRRILLLSLLLVSLLPTTLLTVLAFSQSRAAMLTEIEDGVRRSAAAVSEDVDTLLLERMLNASTWNHLEVMQDLRLHDVDKRLSGFLAEMKRRHNGFYLDLHAVGPDGHVISSSNPALLDRRLPAAAAWLTADLPGGRIVIEKPAAGDGGMRLRLRSAIESEFTAGAIGELVLDVDWSQLQVLLDRSAGPSRQVLVLDHDGRLLAASAALRARALAPEATYWDWGMGRAPSGVEMRSGAPLMDEDVIAGHQRSRGLGDFRGFGWTTLLLQSRREALAPVDRMAWTFAGLLAATALLIVGLAWGLAALIARPVVALTEYARRYTLPGELPPPPPPGPGEIGELTRSFVRMMRSVDRSQQTLVQASKLAALGEITALLAHEIRTPLGILRSSAQMLRAETGLSDESRELLRIIDSETGRLNRLVSSMLDSARTRAPQFAATDAHTLIAHSAALLASQLRSRGVTVDLQCAAQRSIVSCDAEQITQVLLNLIMNALQVLQRGGHIRVSTRNEAQRLVVEVADDGPGIAAEDREAIFEPFVFRREGGVGLGLAVVRRILRQHGGDVVAEAGPLGGALFRFWLPLQEAHTT